MKLEQFPDGYAIQADSTLVETRDYVHELIGDFGLIIADPPYGNILRDQKWDRFSFDEDKFVEWMLDWTRLWQSYMSQGSAFYCWGGIGIKNFRPFIRYMCEIEKKTPLEISTLVTWSKRRGYGISHSYLFTREELLYTVNGNPKKPRVFNIPLLDEKRGYAGFDDKYPAKSEFKRRTNVWVEPELLRGKHHAAAKAARVIEIPIESSSNPGEWVIDPFAGSGTTAHACRKLGRKFVVVENDEKTFDDMVARLR